MGKMSKLLAGEENTSHQASKENPVKLQEREEEKNPNYLGKLFKKSQGLKSYLDHRSTKKSILIL